MHNTTHNTRSWPQTSWTLVLTNPTDFEELLRQYWHPMLAFLRRLGLTDAEEILSDFITEKMLKGHLMTRPDPTRGRFRNFLQKAMQHHALDYLRKQKRQLPGGWESLDEAMHSHTTNGQPAAIRVYEYEWAVVDLKRAVKLTEEDCRARGQDVHWAVFEEWMLRPLLAGCERPSVESLVNKFQLRDRQEVYDKVSRVKAKFNQALRAVVSLTLEPGGDVESEIAALVRLLEEGPPPCVCPD